jgi:hypothetical protein
VKTIIFAHRANIEYNKEMKANIRPCWLIYQNGVLYEAKEFYVKGAIKSRIDFNSPLPFEGGVCCWLETENEVIWQ